MKTSVQYQKVVEAMAKARSEMPAIVMDANNPYFKSKYATLGAILSTIQPILDKHKLSIISSPEGDGTFVGVTTRVSHFESDEWVEATVMVPLKGATDKTQIVQVAGIDFSYLRRYSINALFNLYAEEDTDGNLGYEKPPRQVQRPVKTQNRVKASKNEPVEPEEEVDPVAALLEEFAHLYNKARGLGNEKKDLPVPSKEPTEQEMLEKIAEISMIIKASEEDD